MQQVGQHQKRLNDRQVANELHHAWLDVHAAADMSVVSVSYCCCLF